MLIKILTETLTKILNETLTDMSTETGTSNVDQKVNQNDSSSPSANYNFA